MRFIISCILVCMFTLSVYGYLDPGSGSMLLYALLGILATLLYSLKNIYYKLIKWITGKTKTSQTHIENAHIVFHSEGGKYWNVFAPVIKALEKYTIPCAYVTPDPQDPALHQSFSHLEIVPFNSDLQAILFMNKLRAPLVVSTTPQLDTYMLHRSKHVQHYCHIIHAPTDVLIYKKFAFDFYDSMLCSGKHQIAHIRALEEYRKTKPKLLLETGCTYYDVLKTDAKNILHIQGNTTTILFAPTWGAVSAITKYGFAVFEHLLTISKQLTIIFRPHPQLKISQADVYKPLLNKLQKHPQIEIDEHRDSTHSMSRADVLLSDISGIIFDFAFLYKKPIVLLDTELQEMGYETDGIIPYTEIWEYKIRKKIARVIALKDLPQLAEIIDEVRANSCEVTKEISLLRSEYVYNFGNAGKVAAKQLASLLDTVVTDTPTADSSTANVAVAASVNSTSVHASPQ